MAYKIICGDAVTEFLVDVNGEGAAFFDYDNDGDPDIYLVNGSSRKLEKTANPPHDYLLRNNGDGTFTDVTAQAHLGDTSWSSGCAVGDYNNDGYLDLYFTNFGPNKLYPGCRKVHVGSPQEAANLNRDILGNIPCNICQSEISPTITIGQLGMIESEQVQHS